MTGLIKKVFVLSNTLKEVDASMVGRAEVILGDLKDIAETLKGKCFENLYIDGGKTIQAFLNEGLIDEITINRIPILLGSGILFGNLDDSLKLEYCTTEIIDGGRVKSHYKKV